MAATLLIWRSHGNANRSSSKLLNAGHASLVLSYESPTNVGMKHEFATMTWFPEEDLRSGQMSSGMMSLGKGPESSGSSSGHVRRPPIDMFRFNVIHELTHNALTYRDAIREELTDLLNRQFLLPTEGGLTSAERARLRVLNERYPVLQHHIQSRRNQGLDVDRWLLDAVAKHHSQVGLRQANQVYLTRVRLPDQQAEIPTTCDDNVLIGLNDIAMMLWWRRFSDEKKTYNLLSQNCSTICGNALIAGGGTAFGKCPVSFVWTPEAVYNWAVQLRDAIRRKNQDFLDARDRIRSDPSEARGGRIWSVNEWKRESALYMAHRYKALTEVDYQLTRYHMQTAVPFHSRAVRRVELRTILATIVLQLDKIILDHQWGKKARKSRRHEAIIGLGRQCLAQIEALHREEQRDIQAATNHAIITNQYFQALYKLEDECQEGELKSIRDAQAALNRQVGLNDIAHDELENVIRRMQHMRDMLGGEPEYVPNPNRQHSGW